MEDKNQEIERAKTAGGDFASSIFIMILSVLISLWSLKMPKPGGWGSGPGLMPLLLGISLFCMALGLFLSSLRRHGPSRFSIGMRRLLSKDGFKEGKAKRSLWIMFLSALYLFGMIGRMPFEAASFVYLACTLFLFWRKGGWPKILLVSALLPLALGFLFRVMFVMILPGNSIFEYF